MDIAGALASVAPPGARRSPSTTKIVTLDIERLPGFALVPFWDLGAYKNRRIPADYVQEWPRTICAAWREYGKRKVEFTAEWETDRDDMLRRLWTVYDEADVIVGHNIDGFDTKKLRTEWRLIGLPSPRPIKSVDTLKVARREFSFESNTLDSLAKRLGVPGKVDHYDALVAQAAVDGDPKSQRKIKRYNCGDVETSEALYDALRGWISNHPNTGHHGDDKVCNQCESTELTLQPSTYRAIRIDYSLYRCDHCGGLIKGGWHSRAATTSGVH